MARSAPAASPPPVSTGSAVTRNAAVLLAVVAAGAALYWLRGIVTPLALAIFLLVMIDGLAAWVEERLSLPHWAVMPLSLGLVVLGFGLSVYVVVDGLAGLIIGATGLDDRLNAIISDVAGLVGIRVAPSVRELVSGMDLAAYAGQAALTTQTILSGVFFTLIYLGFLLASRSGFRKKIVALFPTRDRRHDAMAVIARMRGGVEGYLWVQTVTGLMISATAWVLMAIVGLENPLFWAFLIFVVGYVPVIGGAIAGLAPPLFALVQFDSYTPAVVLLVGLQLILFISGNFIQPRMQGQNQNLDPVVVLLSLALWSALWGPIGAFLSTPLAVVAMALTAEFKGSRWMAVLLSGDGEPYPDPPEPRHHRLRGMDSAHDGENR